MSAPLALLSLYWTFGSLWLTGTGTLVPGGGGPERGPASLNDMFREVEELMENTQHILEEAVDQIITETAKSSSDLLDLRPNGTRPGAVQVADRTDKETNTQSGDARLSLVQVGTSSPWNSLSHDCMVDEDCGDLRYCLYEIENSKCLPCIPMDMPCSKDSECCSAQLCVWGQCTPNATLGTEGTICQGQSDCRPHLCCAFQREFLFPVCNPRPGVGESCLSHPNLLMDLLAWDQEGPGDHCPCAKGLLCQPHGRGSVCAVGRDALQDAAST